MDEERVVKLGLEPQDPNSGIFYVLFDEFLNHFRHTIVSFVHQDFNYKSIKSNPLLGEKLIQPKYQIVRISIKKPSVVYLQALLPNIRLTKNKERSILLPENLTLIIGEINQKKKEHIKFIRGKTYPGGRQILFQFKLQPGEYVALIDIQFNPEELIIHREL